MKIKKLIGRYAGAVARRIIKPMDQLAYQRFYDFPFGNKPWAPSETYLAIHEKAKSQDYPRVTEYERETGYAIDPQWFQDLALLTQVVVKDSDICYQHGRLLYATLSSFLAERQNSNVTILETGTSRGFSTLCMAKALQDKGGHGKILTFDILPHHSKMFWNCIGDQKGPQSRAELLGDYKGLVDTYIIFCQGDTRNQLGKVQMPRVNFAFLDGMHNYDYIQQEFSAIRGKQEKGDIVFFDDYTPGLFPGVVKAVDELCDKEGYSKKVITISEQRGYVIAQKQ